MPMRKTNKCIFCVYLQKVIFVCRTFLPKAKKPAKTTRLSGKSSVINNQSLYQIQKRIVAKNVEPIVWEARTQEDNLKTFPAW